MLNRETERTRSARSKTLASSASRLGPPKRTSWRTSWLVTASLALRVGTYSSLGQ